MKPAAPPSATASRAVSLVRLSLATVASVALLAAAAIGCLDRPVSPAVPNTSNVFVDQLKQSAVDKIDILFMIDNSASMADKQEILRDAVPDLVSRLVNPVCVDKMSGTVTPPPANPNEPCTTGEREFKPIKNIHIGIITSSLGGHGADSCSPAQGGQFNPTMDDGGRLIARDVSGNPAPNYQSLGFLVWDPDQNTHAPPGEANEGTLAANFQTMVQGAGEVGCGFEANLEAWYRFLIDPEPYAQIVRVPCFEGDASNGCAAEDGVDQTILQQRADFLRPDSLVAIIMLSDENDCSVIDDGQFFISVQSSQGAQPFHLPRPTDECANDPDNQCCRSCGQPAGGCPDNSAYQSCQTTGGFYDSAGKEDQLNLRCYNQKRRFGIDFLYPIGRYVAGLRDLTVRLKWNDQNPGNKVANPLYSNLQGTDAPVRDPSLVFLAGIVGVPYQLLQGDLLPGDPPDALRYKTADDIADTPGLWDQIVGACPGDEISGDCCKKDGKISGEDRCAIDQRQTRGAPTEPLMIETSVERSGAGISGALAPSSAGPGANPINGHEWNISDNDDLQYACIFPLATPRDCSMQGSSCDCTGNQMQLDTFRKPLCQSGAGYGSTQIAAKAYPGLRQLQVLKGYGSNSIIASICARNVDNQAGADFGYRPAIGAIVDRLKEQLQERCLPRELAVDDTGLVPCAIVEATRLRDGQTCDCNRAAHTFPDEDVLPAVRKKLRETGACGGDTKVNCELDFCFCKVLPAGGDAEGNIADQGAYSTCQTQENPLGVDGWCYIDPPKTSAEGTPERDAQNLRVDSCPATERRKLAFVGEGQGQSGSIIFVACVGEAFSQGVAGQ